VTSAWRPYIATDVAVATCIGLMFITRAPSEAVGDVIWHNGKDTRFTIGQELPV